MSIAEDSASPRSARARTELWALLAVAQRDLTKLLRDGVRLAISLSCPVEAMIENYNECMRWTEPSGQRLSAYLFWGAEYWIMRELTGDPRYMQAFASVLAKSA